MHSVDKDHRRKKRRNDGPWRKEVMALRGERCRSCGATRSVQADHVVPRSQQGPSIVENGLPLCRKCHDDKTASRLKIQPSWLDDDQIVWLAEVGWVAWDADGQPYGRGWRHFEERRVEQHGRG
jgi:5-methylcytosine-specific restriction endonuclease McrA